MRLLIYLLAMMTGFSAAEAARPVAATPAAVAQGAIVADLVASVEIKYVSTPFEKMPELTVSAVAPVDAAMLVATSSPVLRHDLTRQ